MTRLHSRLQILALALVIAWWLIPAAPAAELIGRPTVTPLAPGSVVVRWRTDVPTGTRVHYGLRAEPLDLAAKGAEGEVTDMHEIVLGDLQPGRTYFFSAGTARQPLTNGTFTTSASPALARAPVNVSPASRPPPPPQPSFLGRVLSLLSPAATPAATAPLSAPPARQTWGNPASLPDHFARHGADFRAQSAEEYAGLAWAFRQRAIAGELLVKLDDDGTQRVFDGRSGAFAAYNRDGSTKTFFKPGSRDYFERQPGHSVRRITP